MSIPTGVAAGLVKVTLKAFLVTDQQSWSCDCAVGTNKTDPGGTDRSIDRTLPRRLGR